MTKDTLAASSEGIKIIREQLKRLSKSQKQLALDIFCSRETISSLLRGNNVERETLESICGILDLNLQEIVKPEYKLPNNFEISSLVNQLRQQVQEDIETRCGTMRILDMSQPIGLGKIYTKVNILEKIIGRRRKEIAELIKNCNLEDFDRFNLGKVTDQKIPGTDAVTKYNKLLILGKPGAGKTTFLKHLAIQCSRDQFQGDLVPFFVTLKDFAETENETSLLAYLSNYIESENQNNLKQVLSNGKALILLDGLDEVLEADSLRVIKEIENLTNKYPNNQYVMR